MDGLRAALAAQMRGEVAFDVTARALTTMDASNYRRVPLGVVRPRDADDVAAALSVCRAHGVPVVPRGGGTSIAGQATGTGVVLDLTRHMNRIVTLDPESRTAVVQPGVVLDRLQEAAAPHGLRFNRPLHAQPLHPRRHDREQLLRLALGGLGHDGGQRARTVGGQGERLRRTAGPELAGRPGRPPDLGRG